MNRDQEEKSLEARKISLAPILNIVECIICLQVVKLPFKMCKTGHLMCSSCVATLPACPLCREHSFCENSTFVKQLLESIPHYCRHSAVGCKTVVEPNDNHEARCKLRPVGCKQVGCHDKVPLSQLIEHYKAKHEQRHIFNLPVSTITWHNYKFNDGDFENLPFTVFGHIFWLQRTCKGGIYMLSFHVHPLGELERDYFISLKLEKGGQGLTYRLKANVDGKVNDSTCYMKIDRTSVEWFKTADGKLVMEYEVYDGKPKS